MADDRNTVLNLPVAEHQLSVLKATTPEDFDGKNCGTKEYACRIVQWLIANEVERYDAY